MRRYFRQQQPNKPRRTSRRKLSLEVLEDRIVPSNIPLNGNTWTNLGPAPIGSGANGRVMAIATDPTDANVIYLALPAAASGNRRTPAPVGPR